MAPCNHTKAVDANGQPIKVYNANVVRREEWDYDIPFSISIRNWSRKVAKYGFWFSNDKEFARMWIEDKMGYNSQRVSEVTLEMVKPLVIDAKGQDWKNIDGKSTDKWAEYAENNGYDGIIIRNVLEGTDSQYTTMIVDDYAVFKPEQIINMKSYKTKRLSSGHYIYRGFEVICVGYYNPDHCVCWEAVDEHGHGFAHSYSLKTTKALIDYELDK